MKTFIRNIKLKNKIVLLVGVPVLGLVMFSSIAILGNFRLYTDSKQFSSLVELVLVGGELMHEIQQERDTSIMYLATNGQKMSQQLTSQQKISDEKIRQFEDYLEQKGRGNFSVKLRSSIDEILSELRSLSSIRQQISSMSVNLDGVMPYYREIIESLMGLDNEFVLQSPNGEISRAASAFSVFMYIKEYGSQERAELSYIFSNDKFGPGMHAKLLNHINAEENYTEEFEHLATREQLNLFHTKMQHPAIHELNGMRETAVENTTAGSLVSNHRNGFD